MSLSLWNSRSGSLAFCCRHLRLAGLQVPFLSLSTSSHRPKMATTQYTEAWLTGPNSTQFYTRTYTPESTTKSAVVFVHGFAEHVGRYTHFHPMLAARGVAVFAFDQRGFGLTGMDKTGKKSKHSSYGKTSWREQMADIDWAIGHARKTFESVPLYLMGHSMVHRWPSFFESTTNIILLTGRR